MRMQMQGEWACSKAPHPKALSSIKLSRESCTAQLCIRSLVFWQATMHRKAPSTSTIKFFGGLSVWWVGWAWMNEWMNACMLFPIFLFVYELPLVLKTLWRISFHDQSLIQEERGCQKSSRFFIHGGKITSQNSYVCPCVDWLELMTNLEHVDDKSQEQGVIHYPLIDYLH